MILRILRTARLSFLILGGFSIVLAAILFGAERLRLLIGLGPSLAIAAGVFVASIVWMSWHATE